MTTKTCSNQVRINQSTQKKFPNYFTIQLSPSTLTSIPYLDGEVTVYEHLYNKSRLFLPPLALLDINQTHVEYNRLQKIYLLSLTLILYTNELRTSVLDYLGTTMNRCQRSLTQHEMCQVKMIPIERYRLVWKRSIPLATDYVLDSSWMSNTALFNKIHFYIQCATNQTCYDLYHDIYRNPRILNGFELEYSTQTEKQSRKQITITGQHLVQTSLYSKLKQMSQVTDDIRYLLVDDMQHLLTETLTSMELTEITDAEYVSQHDQKALFQALQHRLFSSNHQLLGEHIKQQWNSVYWTADVIRPDRIVHLLNNELSELRNRTLSKEPFDVHAQQHKTNLTHNTNINNQMFDNSGINATEKPNRNVFYSHKNHAANQQLIDHKFDDKSKSDSDIIYKHTDRSTAQDDSAEVSVSSIAKFIGGVDIKSSGYDHRSSKNPYGQAKPRVISNSVSSQNVSGNYTDRPNQQNHGWKNNHGKDDSHLNYDRQAWYKASIDDKSDFSLTSMSSMNDNDIDEIRKKNVDFYKRNRQYLQFNGEKFDIKPLQVYKFNLGQFDEKTKFVHRSIVIARVESIHTIPLHTSGTGLSTTVPVVDTYLNSFENKLNQVQNEILRSHNQIRTFNDIISNLQTQMNTSMAKNDERIRILKREILDLQTQMNRSITSENDQTNTLNAELRKVKNDLTTERKVLKNQSTSLEIASVSQVQPVPVPAKHDQGKPVPTGTGAGRYRYEVAQATRCSSLQAKVQVASSSKRHSPPNQLEQ
ncbi:unnamed protein product [Didymodactylos carnosus]|uniref:Uncharacterized protein n=1 Tax=Didymodactylos carnosus TaxID=1234261 RepID=A0A814QWP2_9BILA|nr:unnamed protein product [Didymodactylos carnosus]CAF3889665.1 unnamed protein product [Didymodactylos carnosus]